MPNQIDWWLPGEHRIDKGVATSNVLYRYPHTIPPGWKELRAWSGIATNPVRRVFKGQHRMEVMENVAYRLIERSMFFPGLTQEPVIHREVLRRVVTPDWNWNSQTGKWVATIKSTWRFLDFDHYLELDEIRAKAEEYHQELYRS